MSKLTQDVITNIDETLSDASLLITNILKNSSANKLSNILVEVSGDISILSQVQQLINICGSQRQDISIIAELVLSYALKAERIGPGSFQAVLEGVLAVISGCEDGNTLPSVASFSKAVSEPPRWEWVKSHIERYIETKGDLRDVSMFIEAIKLAGFNGRVSIETVPSQIHSVEILNGFLFNGIKSWNLNKQYNSVKVCIIDGHISSVSEIHHLLQANSELLDPALLFCKGAADDVLTTLKTNFLRGKLSIIPVIVPMELESLNKLADISVVTRTNPITPLKGDLISAIKWDELQTIENVEIFSDQIIIKNNVDRNSLISHLNRIKKSRDGASDETIKSVYNNRIKSLSSSQVIIRLPDDLNYQRSRQHFDIFLRFIKNAIDFGFVSKSCLDQGIVDFYQKIGIFQNEKVPDLLSTYVITGVFIIKCIETIRSLGSIVIEK